MSTRLFALFAALLLAACAPDAKELGWTVAFATPALQSESAHVKAWILRGGCDGTERVYEVDLASAPSDRRSEALRPGLYGFGATATSSACVPIAQGCVELRVPADTDAPVDITLSGALGTALCGADRCSAGVCAPTQTEDASVAMDAAASDTGVANDCPEGVRRPDGRCYRYYDLTIDYADARELCALWDADVTVLDSAEEEAWIAATLGVGGDYWIGITDQATEGTWLTVNGSALSYTHWDPGDSAGSNANNCARYYTANGMWRDLPCSDEFRVVCERP